MRDEKKEGDEVAAKLEGEEARAALITLVEQCSYIELKMSLPSLRTSEIVQVGTDPAVVRIGKWRCNLEKRTFVVAVDAPPIFAEYQGEFRKTPANKWTASFTHIRQT